MSPIASVTQHDENEIDPIELAKSLWNQKWLILGITAITTAIALIYALMTTPLYEAKSSVIAPKRSDISGYNVARLSIATAMGNRLQGHDSGENAPSVFTTEEVYSVFKRNLLSASLRNTFFESRYLPYLGESMSEDQDARDRLLEHFRKVLVVHEPDARQRPGLYEVKVELSDAELAAQWANEYIEVAAKRAEQEMIDDISSEIRNRQRITTLQIERLRASASAQRMDRIARLEEALQVALALGIEAPQITAGRVNADSELAAFVEGDLMYMRGTKALKAELDVLRSREIDDPFVPDLRRLQSRLELLDNIEINRDAVAVYTLDGIAQVPETPIKPNKTLIVVFGLLLGGILGCVVALVRLAVRHHSKANS